MAQRQDRPVKGIWLELQTIAVRGREVWRLIPAAPSMGLGGGGPGDGIRQRREYRNSPAPGNCGQHRQPTDQSASRQGGRHADRPVLSGFDRWLLLDERRPERAPPFSGGERLHSDRSRHVRPPGRPHDEGGPLGPVARAGRRAPRADHEERRRLRAVPPPEFPRLHPGDLDGKLRDCSHFVQAARHRAGDGGGHPDLDLAHALAAHDPEGGPARFAPNSRSDGRDGRRAALGDRLHPRGQHPPPRGPPRRAGRPSEGARRRSAITSRCPSSAAARR